MSTAALKQDVHDVAAPTRPPNPPRPFCAPCVRDSVMGRADVYASCDAIRYRAAVCAGHAAGLRDWARAQDERPLVTFELLAGETPLTHVDALTGPIDLAQFAKEVLDGVVGDLPIPAFPTAKDSTDVIAATLEPRLGRPLTSVESASVARYAAAEAEARYEARQQGLQEVQSRLHRPLFAMGGR